MPDYSQPYTYAESSATTPKPESVTSVIGRLYGLVEQIEKATFDTSSTISRIDGSNDLASAGTLKSGDDKPEPSHILFQLHGVEKRLANHLGIIQAIANRLSQNL